MGRNGTWWEVIPIPIIRLINREKNYIPQKFACLRRVPLYANFIKERYDRCLDLYLAPRTLKRKINIDKNILLPELPNIAELRPFPTTESYQFNHHEGRVRSIHIDATGYYLASGGDDKKRIYHYRMIWLMCSCDYWTYYRKSHANDRVPKCNSRDPLESFYQLQWCDCSVQQYLCVLYRFGLEWKWRNPQEMPRPSP